MYYKLPSAHQPVKNSLPAREGVRGEYPLEINPPEKNPQTVTPGDEPGCAYPGYTPLG